MMHHIVIPVDTTVTVSPTREQHKPEMLIASLHWTGYSGHETQRSARTDQTQEYLSVMLALLNPFCYHPSHPVGSGSHRRASMPEFTTRSVVMSAGEL